MKFSICNLGCKVNAYEAESVASILESQGWERTGFGETCDAALIFTCAVTNTAAAKSRKMLHRIRRQQPECITAVVGCYAQINDGCLDEADIILGSKEKSKLPEYLNRFVSTHEKIREIDDLAGMPFEPLLAGDFENHSRAYLKIQDGCNQFCSYCIIPYARGRERSMEPDLVVREIRKIAASYSEVVLTGIHTGRYGREHGVTLAQLMERLLQETPIQRIRISSIEITEIDDALISLMEQYPDRIARHLHIPLQSGCDSVLAAMHRPYTTQQYYDRIESIRKRLGHVAVSCDLMTGFPGESDADHKAALAFAKQCGFSFMHVFPFSERQGTPAAAMAGSVPVSVRKERAREAIALSDEMRESYAKTRLGIPDVIVAETYRDGYTDGYTSDYVSVRVKGCLPHGKMVKVVPESIVDHQVYAKELIEHETD
ncbi:MAG: tRNA (N(6)-L-threonylcarbamoyladenosine(37)-C(2))-methylthiotransferase MtaB [Bulleidia sp.]